MRQPFIVYERAPLHAPAFARLDAVELREVRSFGQARSAMEKAPASIAALEVRWDNLVQTTEVARWAKCRFPIALVAMPSRSIGDRWNDFLYESGVDLIFHSNLELNLVGRLVQRQRLRSQALAANAAPIPFRKQVWQQLPWKRHASGGSS